MTVAPQTTRLRRRHNDYVIGDDGNLRAALRECVQFTWMRIPAAIVLSTFLIALVRVEYGLIWLGVVLGLEGLGVGISAQRLKSGKGLAAVAVGIGLAVSICWTAHELLLWRAGGYIARIAMVMDVFTIALYAVLGAHRDLRLMAAFSKRVAHIEVLVSAHMTQYRCQRYLRHLVFTTWLHVKRQQKFAARLWLGALSRAQSSFCRRALLNFEVGCLMSRCTSISQLDQSGWSLPEAALQVKGPRPVDAVKDACSPAGRARYPGMHDRAGNCSRR